MFDAGSNEQVDDLLLQFGQFDKRVDGIIWVYNLVGSVRSHPKINPPLQC
jgi:hypothetical protein